MFFGKCCGSIGRAVSTIGLKLASYRFESYPKLHRIVVTLLWKLLNEPV